jgi:Transposase DDE domain group 1
MDAFAAGEARVFGLADPLFVRLAGGVVPSLDTVYRDLARFDETTVAALEGLMATQGLKPLGRRLLGEVFLDVDTTVEPLFGSHEGAAVGPNPRYPGRPSYHPVLARVAETDTCVGALLRPGDTAFGEAEVPLLERWIERLRQAVGPACVVHVRIDSAGDCAEVFAALERKGCWGTVKARLTHNLLRRYVLRAAPTLQRWRAPWLRRARLAVPGRLVRSGRCWTLRLAPRPMLS